MRTLQGFGGVRSPAGAWRGASLEEGELGGKWHSRGKHTPLQDVTCPAVLPGRAWRVSGAELPDVSASFQMRGSWEAVALLGPNQGRLGQTRLSWSPHE